MSPSATAQGIRPEEAFSSGVNEGLQGHDWSEERLSAVLHAWVHPCGFQSPLQADAEAMHI